MLDDIFKLSRNFLKTFNKPYRSSNSVQTYTRGTSITIDDKTDTQDQLVINQQFATGFYIDDMELVKLDDEGNEEYYDGLDTNVQGYSDIGNGKVTRTQAGRVTEKAGVFYLPKDTEITLFDYIIYNDEAYGVIGINNDYPTHLVVDALFREVWNE